MDQQATIAAFVALALTASPAMAEEKPGPLVGAWIAGCNLGKTMSGEEKRFKVGMTRDQAMRMSRAAFPKAMQGGNFMLWYPQPDYPDLKDYRRLQAERYVRSWEQLDLIRAPAEIWDFKRKAALCPLYERRTKLRFDNGVLSAVSDDLHYDGF